MSSTPFTGTGGLGRVIPFPAKAVSRGDPLAHGFRHFELAAGTLERVMDLCSVVAVVLPVTRTITWRNEAIDAVFAGRSASVVAIAFGILVVLMLDKGGGYGACLSLLAVRETERLLRVSMTSSLLAIPVLIGLAKSVRWYAIGLAVLTMPVALAIEKWLTQTVIRSMRLLAGMTRKAVIVGTGPLGRRIFSSLARSAKLGIEPVAFVEADGRIDEPEIFENSYQRKRRARVLAGPVTPAMLRRLGASLLILADPQLGAEAAEFRAVADDAGAITCVVPEPFAEDSGVTEYLELDGVMLAYEARRKERRLREAVKRALDIAVSGVTLILLMPVMAAVAVTVKLGSSGPIIFRQKRIGRDGLPFEMYKFRTMYADSAEYARSPACGKDPRITRVGRVLRHTCIDELPQLFNVLRGEMSLVGPRPEMPFIVDTYEEVHRRRLEVKPGITGLWQLSADRMSPIHHNISYDLYYVRHRGLWMDTAILLHTVVFAFRGV